MKKNLIFRLVVVLIVIAIVIIFFKYDLSKYLTLDELKARQYDIENYYKENPVLTITIYMAGYIIVTALSLPGATVMSLAGGALFGLWMGTLIVSFASTIGATLAFLVARFLLKDYVQKKFGDKFDAVNKGIEKEGAFYLFTLRLVPLFPFFMINFLMALTPIKALTFYIVSQTGMLPGTLVYINAGTQLAKLESLRGILSPGLILSFALLGIFPILAKKTVGFIKARKVLAKYPRPKKFDYNLVVIGGGSAGLVSAFIGAAVKAKVALVEKDKMGGDCLNTGCVPSKALIRSAKMISYAKRAKEFGFDKVRMEYDFKRIMDRVKKIIKKIEPHDSVERFSELGVDCIKGEAMITSPYTVEAGGKTLVTKNIIIATGARPFVPPIPGINKAGYLTSDNVWDLENLPPRLLVLGGGPIGCELTQAFARLGSKVTQVEMLPKLLMREDEEISDLIREKFIKEGIDVLTGHMAKKVKLEDGKKILVCDKSGQEVRVEFDEILVAVGRAANTKGFGLKRLGVEINPQGTVAANELLKTNFPNIYCAGDVAGPYQFTHTASHQAWYATINALFGAFKSFRVDYRVIPWATYTDPEVARVGLNELEAREKKIEYEVTKYPLSELDRAITDSEDHGFIKVLTRPGTDRILGVTIVGAHGADIISEYVLAMKYKIGLNKILGTIHIYPTLAEANKAVAGAWKRNHAPERLLSWIEKYHNWVKS